MLQDGLISTKKRLPTCMLAVLFKLFALVLLACWIGSRCERSLFFLRINQDRYRTVID
ncbi:predicted protein [Enterococcus gallinarum EG2]|nr:predicted protein [Enterococcus gallinarum EG2]